jgi:broad specificity phosphatase PhoE
VNKTDPVLVTVLRHGAVAGRAQVFRGALDDPLSAQGAAQMHATLARVPSPAFDTVATSPLRRCHEFAAAYVAQHGVPLYVSAQFSELAFGDWEGLTPAEAAAHHAPPGGESLAQLRARASQGWHEWLGQDAGTNRLLVTHAGVMRALLMELFGFTAAQAFQVALPEAASLRISWLHGQPPFLLSIN